MTTLDKEQFAGMREELATYDNARDELIKQSRSLLKDAKHAVYLVHQGEVGKAQELLHVLKTAHVSVEKEFSEVFVLESIGPYAEAIEEYVEAACFVAFANGDQIPTRDELHVPAEQYLCGLSDLTGELARRAVFLATKRDKQQVTNIHEFIQALQGELVQFHLRNGLLRKKYDSIKYNLKKVEETLYDLELRA